MKLPKIQNLASISMISFVSVDDYIFYTLSLQSHGAVSRLRNTDQRVTRIRRPRLFYGDSQVTPPRPSVSTTVMRRRDSSRNSSQLSINDVVNEMDVVNEILSPCENMLSQEIIDPPSQNPEMVINSQIIPNLDIMMELPVVNDIAIVDDVIQLGLNMTEERIKLYNDLNLAASGIVPDTLLSNQPSIIHSMNTFIENIFKNVLKFCTVCKENWFTVISIDDSVIPYECLRCLKEKKNSVKKNVVFVGSMSASNNMDPYYHISQVAND